MPTLAETAYAIGYPRTSYGGEAICVRDGGRVHELLARVGDRLVPTDRDQWIASGLFIPGRVQRGAGRSRQNLQSILHIPLDFDLAPWLGHADKTLLLNWDDAELDRLLDDLEDEVVDVLTSLRIPISYILSTGYGILTLSTVQLADRGEIEHIRALNGAWVERINREYGGERDFADRAVRDAGTRIVRLPHTINTKNPDRPRPCVLRTCREDVVVLSQHPVRKPPSRHLSVQPPSPRTLSQANHDGLVDELKTVWEPGGRHDLAWPLAGLLYKSGVGEEETTAIIQEVSGDEDSERDDRLRAVRDTYRRGADGESVAGFSQIRRLVPPESLRVIERRLRPLPDAASPARQLNDRGEISVGESLRSGGNAGNDPFASYQPSLYAGRWRGDGGWVDRYIDLMAPTTSAPDAFHYAVATAYIGLVVGRRVSTYHGTVQYPFLYPVLVGPTKTARKTTAMRRGQDFFGRQKNDPGFSLPFTEVAGAITGERLVDLLATGPVMLWEDEFSELIMKAKQSGSGIVIPAIMRMWNCLPRVEVQRVTGSTVADNYVFSMILAQTPEILARDMSRDDLESGFANRLLFVFGDGGEHIPIPPKYDEDAARELYRELRANIARYGDGCELPKSEAATAWWLRWDAAFEAQTYQNEAEIQYAARIPDYIHRLAIIHAVCDGGSRELRPEHFEPAANYVMERFEDARAHVASWGRNDDARRGAEVLHLIRERRRMGLETQAQDVYAAIGARDGAREIMATLAALERVGVVAMDSLYYITELGREVQA